MRVRGWFLVLVVSVSACTPNDDMVGDANGGYLADPEKYVGAADWVNPVEISVDLSEFKFRPKELSFRAGQAYALKLTNNGLVAHNFVASEFYRAVAVRSILYANGEGHQPRIEVISLESKESKTLFFVAVTPGEYPLICDKPLHAKLGMNGSMRIETE